MIFRRQLITAATAIVTVLSLCCVVATEAHTLSDAIVPEATSDTADLLVLADQYSDPLTDAASSEKRAHAAEGSENKLKSGEQAEVTRLKDASHPALVESTAAAIGTAIPLHSVNSLNGWQPLTYVSIGSGTPIPVLVDTGSQITALCPHTDTGDSTPVPGEYACKMYHNMEDPTGWEGLYRSAKVTFGKGTQITADSSEMKFGTIESSSDKGICSPKFRGILGVALGAYSSYKMKVPSIVKGTKWAGCCGDGKANCVSKVTSHREGQFAKTMLASANERAMAFIGVTQDNSPPGVLAFGATAHTMLNPDKRIGSLQLMGNPQGYYSFAGSITYRIKGWAAGCKLMNRMLDTDDCSYTWVPITPKGPNPKTPMAYIDSGTQTVEVPGKFFDSLVKAAETLSISPLTHPPGKHAPPRSATLEISFEKSEAKLEFSDFFAKAFELNSLHPKTGLNWFMPLKKQTDVPVFGFSAFWDHDFLFQLNRGVTQKSAVIGTLEIYGR